MSDSNSTLEVGGREREVQVIDPASNRLEIKNAHVGGLVLTNDSGDERRFTYNQLKEAHFKIAAESYGILNEGVTKIQSEAKKQRHALNREQDQDNKRGQ